MTDTYRISSDKRITNWYNRTADNASQINQSGNGVTPGTGLNRVSDLAPEVADATAGSVTTPRPGAVAGPYAQATAKPPADSGGFHPLRAAWHGLMAAGEWWNREVYQPYIDDPLVFANLALAAPVARKPDQSLGDYLDYAWGQRGNISLGQSQAAVEQEYRQGTGTQTFTDPIQNIDAFKASLNPVTVDPLTGEQHQQIDWRTGTLDFVASMGLDPLNYVGAPAKALTTGMTAPKIVDDIGKAQTAWSQAKGVISIDRVNDLLDRGRMDPVLRRFTEITDPKVAREYADSLHLNADDPDTFAFLSSQIDSVDGMKDLFTLSLRPVSAEGAAAADRLRQAHGADLAYYAQKYAGNDPLLAEALQSADDLLLGPKTREVMDAVVKNADVANPAALERSLSFSQGIYKTATEYPGGSLRNAPTTNRAFERLAFHRTAQRTRNIQGRNIRGGRYAFGTSDDPVVTTYKPHRWHPAVWYIEKPSGLVEPGSADAFKEMDATFRQLNHMTKGEFVRSGRAAEWTDRWFQAGTLAHPEDARARVAGGFNEYAVNKLMELRHPEMTPTERKSLTDALQAKAVKVRSEINDKGWLSAMTDEGGIGIIRYPALQRATANAVSMYDLRAFDRAIQKHDTAGMKGLALDVMTGGTAALDAAMGIWKVSVLLRLGYTVRNLAEASLSLAATGNVGNILSEVGPERARTWLEGSAKGGARQIDRMGVAGGILDEPQALWDQRQGWDAALAATDASARQLMDMLTPKRIKELQKTDPALAAEMEAIRVDLAAREVTYHANDVVNMPGQPATWSPAKDRYLSTTPSQTLARANVPKASGPAVPGAPIPDTRGQQIFYHGTSQRILGELESDTYSTMNIFGQGMYTTDDLTTAISYTKKGKGNEPAVHRITPKEDVKFYDLEGPVGDEIADWLRSIEESSDTAADLLVDLEAGHFTTPRQIINSFRSRSAGYMESADTVQEWFQVLREQLEDAGYGGFSHLGGVTARSSGREHNVRVWWNPKDQLGLEDVDIAAYKSQPGALVNAGQAHQVTSYGETLDLTGGGAASEGFQRDTVRNALRGSKTAIQRLSDAAWARGYGRIILPDGPQWGGQQVIVNQRAVGKSAAKKVVEARMRRYAEEAQAAAPAGKPITPLPRSALKQTKQIRAERRRAQSAREQGRPSRLPINPNYDRELVEAMLNGGVKEYAEALAERKGALEAQVDFLSHRLAQARKRKSWTAPLGTSRRGFQQGTHEFVSRAGINYDEVPDVFAIHGGGFWETKMGGDSQYSVLAGDAYRGLMATGQMVSREVQPTNPRYFEAWANTINLHFRDHQSGLIDPVVEKAITGEGFDQIYDWAINTPEGYQWAKGLGISDTGTGLRPDLPTKKSLAKPEDIEKTVASLMSAVDMYLPEGPIRDAFRAGDDISQDLLRDASKGQELHPLQARLIPTSREAADERNLAQKGQKGLANLMKVLGSIPETSFARHPLFAAAFQQERRNLVALAEEAQGGARLSPVEWHKLETQAARRAQRTTEKTLFTTTRRSTVSGNAAVRTTMPFVAAYENVVQRWTGFVAADPSIPLRFANYLDKASQGLNVVDQDGNVVHPKDWTGEELLMLPGLDALHLPGALGRAAKLLSNHTQVPIKSLDVLTQGQPFNPGIGPLAILPLAMLVRRQPSAEKYLKWSMPYGVPETNAEIFLSSGLKRAMALRGDSVQYANSISKAYIVAYDRWEKGGMKGDPPKFHEVEHTAWSMQLLRLAVSMTSPFATTFTNERDFYAGKLRSYQDKYGYQDGETMFYTDFPDAGLLVESLSRNPSGMQATAGTVANTQKYADEIAEAYSHKDPEVAGFIANYGVPDDAAFSQAAYQWQRQQGPAGKAGDPFRQVGNPEQQVTEAHIREGWDFYRQATDAAEAQLDMNHVDPTSKYYKDAMAYVKQGVAYHLGTELGNKDWLNEFNNPDTSKYERRSQAFERLLGDTRFIQDHGSDTLVRSMQAFFSLRDTAKQILAARDAAGGAQELGAKANEDLSDAYQAGVKRLRSDSPEFNAWYDRFFSFDAVKAGA